MSDQERIQKSIRLRAFGGFQDSLWVESLEERSAFERVDVDTTQVNADTLVIHVEADEELYSFVVTVKPLS